MTDETSAATPGRLVAVADDPRPIGALLEAVLFVLDRPADVTTLAHAIDRPVREVAAGLLELREEYAADERGFDLQEVGGSWRLATRAAYADVVERLVVGGAHAKLSQAALETLAVVAYRQPVSRSRVSAIRGVNVDAVMRTLLVRGLVEEAGTDPSSTATLYRTTSMFLERLGIASLDELPEVADHLPDLDLVDDDV